MWLTAFHFRILLCIIGMLILESSHRTRYIILSILEVWIDPLANHL